LVTIASGQKVYVSSHKSFGSSAGAQNLDLYICVRSTVAGSPILAHGNGVLSQQVPAGTRVLMGLTWDIANLASGTYQVGLCGSSSSAAAWNTNEWGYTTALVHN
jgi:hypothetical protein